MKLCSSDNHYKLPRDISDINDSIININVNPL